MHLEAGSSSSLYRLLLPSTRAQRKMRPFIASPLCRLARRFPAIFGLVERRAVHLTATPAAARYLTPENHRELLHDRPGRPSFKSRMLARRFPRPDIASTIRKLPSPRMREPAPALALPTLGSNTQKWRSQMT